MIMKESIKVLAGIVLYNPDIERLRENVESIIDQVDEVLLVDNGSHNIEEVGVFVERYDRCGLIKNRSNLGIAAALNLVFDYALENAFDWVLTLDQDSICSNGLIDEYKKYLTLERVGMLTCIIKDRNINIHELEGQSNCEEVQRCITSGAFCSTAMFSEVGGFDEELFIDWVDYEYCARIREAGFRIYKIGFCGLLHEIGRGEIKKLLFAECTVINEAPIRVYYRTRNRLRVSRTFSEYTVRGALLASFKDMIKIVAFEENKRDKLKALLKGIRDAGKAK